MDSKTLNGSEMVLLPRFRMCDVIDGASCAPHPAFMRAGRTLNGIWISQYQNVIEGGVACSVFNRDPAVNVDFDTAERVCADKGTGWHLMTAMEWGAVALWCQKNGFLPYGNNDDGKDHREENVTARVSFENREKGIVRVATGTGPVTWSHDGTADGIFDLCGNVWEWQGDFRLVYGELQCRIDGAWCALDGNTGCWITPDGNGTTRDSVKLDMRDGSWVFVKKPLTDPYPHARFAPFEQVRAEGLCDAAKEVLWALALLPAEDYSYDGVDLYANNGSAERMLFRGGRWGQKENTGLFKSCIDDPRTYAGEAVGFRAARWGEEK
ncbi:MAG: SUMF1/EgtB/PvdO family nonheme iron enzyme [Clostridia bacterium]|nr:SUMF1/EgtB/PvdO family nonheme iron enzyme [Clostridia bacterium]